MRRASAVVAAAALLVLIPLGIVRVVRDTTSSAPAADTAAIAVQPGEALTPPVALAPDGSEDGASAAAADGGAGATTASDHALRDVQTSTKGGATGSPVKITVTVGRRLEPGITAPVTLSFVNPNRFPVDVRNVTTSVRAATSDATCPVTQNFVLGQTTATFRVRASASLTAPAAQSPTLTMRNLATNQNGCKGLRLTVTVTATVVQGA